MLLFKHIFDFKHGALGRLRDQRKSKRYPVAPGFPLKAAINLLGLENPTGPNVPAPGSGRNWGGGLVNISSVGLSLQLPPAAMTARGEQSVLTLTIESHQLTLPCRVAHFRIEGAAATCGINFQIEDPVAQKAYLQLVEALATGAEFGPTKGRAKGAAGFVGEYFASGRDAKLVAWRDKTTKRLAGFEMNLGPRRVRGTAGHLVLEITAGADGAALPTAEAEEVRRLYRWMTLNLPRSLPSDLRELMRGFTVERGEWKNPTARR